MQLFLSLLSSVQFIVPFDDFFQVAALPEV